MKIILSTLFFPVIMGAPFIRELNRRSGEYRDISSPVDILSSDSSGYEDLACFYKIFMIQDELDYVVDGLYRILDTDNKMGFADISGKVIIKPAFCFVRHFSEGVAAFNEGGVLRQRKKEFYMKGGKWGFINRKGEVVVPPVYDEVEDCKKGCARAIADNCEYILTELLPSAITEE